MGREKEHTKLHCIAFIEKSG